MMYRELEFPIRAAQFKMQQQDFRYETTIFDVNYFCDGGAGSL
jgi:hypothetical protein